jgi:toxin ParE1/3/4
MRRYQFSRLAEDDLSLILTTSEERWGADGRRRYAAIISAALRKLANDPDRTATRDRSEISPGIRSMHLRLARGDDPQGKVRRPVHVIFYRAIGPDLIEIVRILHERMEPSRHIDREISDPENS